MAAAMVKKLRSDKRRTVGAFAAYTHSQPGLYAHMFVQDIENGLMGFRHLRDAEERRVEVEGDEAGEAALDSICTALSDYPGYDLGDTVQRAIESIARRLAWFGKAIYEICGSGAEISLVSVTPHRLFRVPGGFIQLVTKSDRQWVDGRRYSFLPASCAWVVRLPRRLGGPRGHRRLLDQLTAVSQPAPEFWTRDLQAGRLATEFMVADYNRNRDAYIARITRRWGWNRRDSSGAHSTEFFYFFRSLRFRQSQAILRNHIVDEMNKFLAHRGVNARVRLKGFHSPAELRDLIRRVLAGSAHYAEALGDAR